MLCLMRSNAFFSLMNYLFLSGSDFARISRRSLKSVNRNLEFFSERLKAISCIYIQRSLKITTCIEMTNITFMNVMPVSDYMYVAK